MAFDTSTSTTNSNATTQQQQQVGPWGPAQAPLTGLLSQIGQYTGSVAPTDAENSALSGLSNNAGWGQQFFQPMANTAMDAFTGGPDRRGNVTNNYDVLNSQLTPTISGHYLDPNTNPFFQDTVDTIGRDAMERTNALYAGSGRSAPGAGNFGYNAAKGIAEATAPIFANQYNTERGRQEDAFKTLYGAGTNEVNQLSDLDKQIASMKAGGFDLANQGQQFSNQPFQQQLAAEAYRRNIPLSTLASLVGLTTPIAGLGREGTSSGTSTGTSTVEKDPSLLDDLTQIGSLFKK